MNRRITTSSIAVIGLGCWYAGSPNPIALWENVVAGRRQFRRIPESRTSSVYFDESGERPETIYQRNAAVIDGFDFDWAAHRIPRPTFLATDIAHWLALEVAGQTFTQAGYARGTIPNERAGVVVGNSLTGERIRATMMRLRWPYVERVLAASARANGLPDAATTALLRSAEELFKAAFPETSEDTLAGALSNTIAGRICNFFDLHGGGYNVDGACASSLLAVGTAADLLNTGALDLVLAGGVDVSLDPFELVGFSEAGALSKSGDPRIFDRDSDGFVPGEGAGFVLLKRLEDARAHGDRIYAIIRGWGVSSDGKGGIMQPTRAGQAAALRQAHERAGFDVGDLDFIEAHGTGTRVGDATEIGGIALALGDRSTAADPSVGITSIKSVIGHAKAAAGIAGFIKAVMAVHRRVVPPTANCKQPNGAFSEGPAHLHPVRRGRVLDAGDHLRAGVSAFGFGGINCHVAIESGDVRGSDMAPSRPEATLLAHAQDSEVFVFGAEDAVQLRARAVGLAEEAEGLSVAELADLAARMAGDLDGVVPAFRAVIVASTPGELARSAHVVASLGDAELGPDARWSSSDRSVWIGAGRRAPRLGFLFPGQGSQQLDMGRDLVARHPWARELWDRSARWANAVSGVDLRATVHPEDDRIVPSDEIAARKADLARTEVAQPAICATSMLYLSLLKRLGLQPTIVAGHSLGELSAFYAAGAFAEEALVRLASLRGQAMAAPAHAAGAMLGLSCSRERAQEICDATPGYVTIANANAPDQFVLSGEQSAIAAAARAAEAAGIGARTLPVSNAFHSRLVAPAAQTLAASAPVPTSSPALDCAVVCGATGERATAGLDLRRHFAEQVLAPVDFVATVGALRTECDLFLEVGPGQVLSRLVARIVPAPQCFPIAAEPGATKSLHVALAAAFAHGAPIRWSVLFEQRLIRAYVPAAQRVFIANPCEAPLPALAASEPMLPGLPTVSLDPSSVPAGYLERRGAFVRRAIAAIVAADLADVPAPETAAPIVAPRVVAPLPIAVVPAPPRIVPVESAPAPSESVRSVLVALASLRTGYPAHSIHGSARLLDDLNLDSIKAGELVAATARRFDAAERIDPSAFANATIDEIASAIEETRAPTPVVAAPTPVVAAPTPVVAAPIVSAPIPSGTTTTPTHGLFAELGAARTGYPAASITPNARLLDDLNLDSIKAGELVAAFARRCGAADRLDASAFANATAAEVVAAVAGALGVAAEPTPTPTPTPRVATATAPADDLAAALVALVEQRTGYPASSILLTARLLDDLNLDSIKAGELVAAFARRAGAVDRIDASQYANATLLEVLEAVRGSAPANEVVERTAPIAPAPAIVASVTRPADVVAPSDAAPEPPSSGDSWIRDFAITAREEPLRAAGREPSFDRARVLVLCDRTDEAIALALRDRLVRSGATVHLADYATAGNDACTHRIAVLPRSRTTDLDRSHLTEILARLLAIANAPTASTKMVAFVQFGGGTFGADGSDVASCCTVSFCRSLHLERPDLDIRTIDLSADVDPRVAADRVVVELDTTKRLSAVGYDAAGIRRVPAVNLGGAGHGGRPLRWSSADVVLFTGGGKGITAECALAFARATGARVALSGRSRPDADAELAANLERFDAANVSFRYYTCDAADRDAVFALVADVRKDLGPITGVVHGAGLMRPRRAEFLKVAGALDEIAPKLLGASYLAEALAHDPPRLFAGFSSLTAVIGMHGNATYTFSNEALDLVLRNFGHRHPKTTVISIAWGLWGEVGGGVRLDTSKNIARLGLELGLVPPTEGARRFVELCLRKPSVPHVLVTGRVIGFDVWNDLRGHEPLASEHRFIDRVVQHEPGVELVVRTQLSHARDAYLRDHDFRGSILMPSVFMLEAAAQVATTIVGGRSEVIAVEGMDVPRPVVVPPGEGLLVELRGERVDDGTRGESRVRVELRSESTGFAQVYFTATVVLGRRCEGGRESVLLDAPLPIDPRRDFYGRNFFVRGLFERMRRIYAIDPARAVCEAEYRRASADGREGFAEGQGSRNLLGDPFCRDTLLHSSIISDARMVALPLGIDRIEFFAGAFEREGNRYCISRLRRLDDRNMVADLVCTDERGEILERIDGFRIRMMEHHAEWPSTEQLCQGSIAANDELALRKALAS